MFDNRHYVPVLRWKRAECAALRELAHEDRRYMTPLMEITPKMFKKWSKQNPGVVDSVIASAVTDMSRNWGGNN